MRFSLRKTKKRVAGNREISTTTTQRARKENLRRQTLAPSTPTVDMEMVEKLAKPLLFIIYHSDSFACQGHFREEGRCGGGRHFDFPCLILWVRKILQNSHQIYRQISLPKIKKITDELLQERREKTSLVILVVFSLSFPMILRVWQKVRVYRECTILSPSRRANSKKSSLVRTKGFLTN